MDLLVLFVTFVAISLVLTYLIKRFTKQQTFYVISIIRSKLPLPWFERLSKIGKPLDIFADIGLVLGFGAIAIDYLYLRGKGKIVRIPLFAASTIAMSLLFIGIDILLGGMFSTSPFIKDYFYIIALIFGLSGFAGFIIVALVMQAADIIVKYFAGSRGCPGVAPLIPGVEIPGVPIVVPLHGWISLILILVIHEGMHGIVARRNKLKVKSSGVLLFGFLPIGAFVEPDEKEVAKAEPRQALRLFAAGPMANLLAMVLSYGFIILLALGLMVFVHPWAMPIKNAAIKGVQIAGVDQNSEWCGSVYPSPAFGVFEEGMLLKKVNDRNVMGISDVQEEKRLYPYESMVFLMEKNGEETEIILTPNELGLFGFTMEEIRDPDYVLPEGYALFSFVLYLFSSFVGWFFILNFLIAIVNFLPMLPFDGGRIVTIMLVPYFSFLGKPEEETKKFIAKLFLYVLLLLLAVNALPLFI